MKLLHRFSYCILFSILFTGILAGCASGSKKEAASPLSTLGWDATKDTMISAEGTDYSTYDSVYGGTTYTYAKAYEGHDGTIKYMFNDAGALMCIAWTCSFEQDDDLIALYEDIHASLEDAHGESGYNTSNSTSYGDVWYLDSGDIIISTMMTSSNKALQYSYLNPAVSNSSNSDQ